MDTNRSLMHILSNEDVLHTSLSFRQPRIEWVWQSDDSSSDCESSNWCTYSDVEIAIIEQAFQQKLPEAVLDKRIVSFEDFLQISREDPGKQHTVRRLIKTGEDKLREKRFAENLISPSASFGPYDLGGFRRATHHYFDLPGFAYTYENNSLLNAANRRKMVQKAAEGIAIEGKKVGREREGKWLAQQLLNVIDGTAEEVWRVCARLYTMESFLYKKLNECTRLETGGEHEQLWRATVPTFGPFSLLLYYLGEYTCGEMTVYRGCNLSDDLIYQYRQKLNIDPQKQFVFPAFTSTSKNRNMAKLLGNVLFAIDIDCRYDGCDISPYSVFDEEEYLLVPYFAFVIRSCQFNESENKWIIHLRSGRLK